MVWYPGKNLIGLVRGRIGGEAQARNKLLKTRGLATAPPQYNEGTMGAFQGAAQQGGAGFASAQQDQQAALGMYQDAAAGNAPSVAEGLMQQGQDQAVANQMAMAAGGRTGNVASAANSAGQMGSGMAMQGAQQASQLRAAEIDAARAGAAGLSTNMAGQSLQQQGMGLAGMGQASGQQLAADVQTQLGQRGLDIEQLQGNRGFGLGVAKGVTGAIGTVASLAALSDERRKDQIQPSAGAASDAIRHARPSTFEYEPGAGPPGPRTGVMAQGLASTPAGAATVQPTEQGLMVDIGQLSGLTAAGLAETIARVDALEKVRKGKKRKKGASDGGTTRS